MNRTEYLSKRYALIVRLENAISHLCPLTAKARCRDIARLKQEYDGTPIKATTLELEAEYGLLSQKETPLK